MLRSTFSRFFPPPEFLTMPVIGLDISDASLRFVEFIDQGTYVTIGRFGERSIPRGVIEGGEVKKPADLRAILTEVQKTHRLDRVVVAFPEEKLYLFDLKLPSMKKRAIRGAIELVLEEHVPLKVDEVQFDYQIKEETDQGLVIHVSAAPRALVYGYLDAFEGTGITPVVFENEALALARSTVAETDPRAFMIVDLGKTRAGITIISRGLVEYTSTISVGGSAITEAFAKAFSVPFDEAEKIKQEKGLAQSAHAEILLERPSPLATLRDEVRRHYTYWQTHHNQEGEAHQSIETVYLCGGEANIQGFAEYLADGSSIPFTLPNVFVNIHTPHEYVPPITFSDSLRYATAIGLARFMALGYGMANLLPQEEKKRERMTYRLRLGVVAGIVIVFLAAANLALLAPSYLRAGTKEQAAEARVTQIAGVSAEEQSRAEEATRENTRAFEKKTALFLGTRTVAEEAYPARVITDILALREDTVRIQSISYDKTDTRERFVVAGISATRDHLARFVEALKKDTRFTKVEIPISSYVKTNNINFSIALEIAAQGKK